jgi:diaminohydroxyphosphoribosylaminopyrimidine deaminase/5-amino-6-(5-phosphoribosylamino)uracil reductase
MNMDDQQWMRRAVRLATLSLGRTWPNPGVGCVIVRNGKLLGEGRHAVYGQAHAEVNALNQCRALGQDPGGATAYVTLAPCTRQGRQPPCSQALIEAGIGRVVAAINDPNQEDPAIPFAQAGIVYEEGCGRVAATQVHGGFLTRLALGRPRITGKWAMTLDGQLATHTGDSVWISSDASLAFSRRRRRAFDAIMIGSGTASADNPRLLSATVGERTPVRVVVSATADLSTRSVLIATRPSATVLVVHGPQASAAACAQLRAAGVELLAVTDAHNPHLVAQALGTYGFNEVLVEGGAVLHGAYLRAGLYDRLELYLGTVTVGGGLSVAAGAGVAMMSAATTWEHEVPPLVLESTVCLRLRRPPVLGVGEEPVVVED